MKMKNQFGGASLLALAIGLAGCANGPSLPRVSVPGGVSLGGPSADENLHMQGEMKLANAAMKGGDRANAIRIYRRLAQNYPTAIEPRIALGEALLVAGAPQEAARAYEGALNLDGGNYQALTGLGRVQLAVRQPAEAMRLFDKAAEKHPKDHLIQNGRAVAFDQLGHHKEAQAIYLKLLQEDPSNLKVRSNYALSLALEGRHEDAEDILSGLAAAPDADARIRQNLSLVYGLNGNDGQAAHVGRMDLDEDSVQSNLRFFQRLRTVERKVIQGAALMKPADAPVSPGFLKPEPPPELLKKMEEKKEHDGGSSDSDGGTSEYKTAPKAKEAANAAPPIAEPIDLPEKKTFGITEKAEAPRPVLIEAPEEAATFKAPEKNPADVEKASAPAEAAETKVELEVKAAADKIPESATAEKAAAEPAKTALIAKESAQETSMSPEILSGNEIYAVHDAKFRRRVPAVGPAPSALPDSPTEESKAMPAKDKTANLGPRMAAVPQG